MITVGSGAALYLDVSIATTAIGNLTNSGGTIVIEGTINNTGDLFDVGPAGNLGAIDLYSGGTIEGGTIVYPGSGIVFSGGTLSGVTYEGPLNLTVSSSSLYVTDGLTVTGSSGSGPGTINLTGANSYLYMEGTETLNTATNTATLNIGGSSYDYLYNYDPSGAGAVLTLGSNLTINQTGYAYLDGSGSAGDGIVNDGTINASAFDFTLYIDPHSFTNNGTINVSNGATVNIEPTSFTNASGGSIAVGANSTAYIDTSSWSNAGAITVGSGAALYLDVSIATTAIGNLTNSGGTIVIEGTINNTGDMFDVGPAGNLGAIDLYSGGIIEGGTIVYPGSGIVFSGGTLSGVTYEGPLNLTVSSSSLYVTDGLTVTGSSGSGPGTINLTGANSYLYMEGTETLNTATNTATLNIGGSSYDYLYNYDPSGAGAVLTLGSNLTINQTGYAELDGSGSAGDGIVNDGTINASAFTLYIDPHSFTNNGTINVSNGATVNIEPTSFTNASGGSIAVGANSTAYIDTSSWSNAGAITVGSGAALYLDVSIATTAIGNLTNSGGTIVIEGTINNTGDMFDVGPAGNLGAIDLYSGGIIEGGTIVYPGSGIVFSGGTLSGVTYEGPLNLTVSSSSLYVTDGLTVTGSSGSGPGTINLTGANSYLYMEGTETLNTATNTATLNIGGSSYDYLYNYDPSGAGAVLTLGSNLTINQTGYAELEGSGYAGDGIVNDGTINASAFTLTIDPHSFTNNGTINVSNGTTVNIEPTNFTNFSGGTLTGGIYVVSGGSTLTLPQNETISTLAADVTLSGLGSAFVSYQTSGSQYTGLNTTLASITPAGALLLLGGLNANEGQAVSDSGVLQLGGGNFVTSALAINATGSLLGFGTVSAPIVNSGSIEAQSGILQITGAVTGTGAEQINSGATLELDAAVSSGQTIAFETNIGTLALTTPSGFAAAILGFAAGNEIDLIGVTATAVSYQSNVLTVLNGTTTVASLNLSGSYSSDTDFEVVSDGNGGSLITIGSAPAPNGDYWKSAVSGDWGTAADWNPSGAPNGSAVAATISIPGTYTVTIANDETFAVGSLDLNNSLATLSIAGELNVSSLLGLNAGALALSGTISGGIIQANGGNFTASGGTLSGVTYEGPLNLSASSSGLYVTGGLTVTGSSGSGPGTINLTGANSYLYMEGTETLNTATNTATLNIGGSSYDYLYNYDPSGAGAVLTLGSNLTINQTGYAELDGSGSAGDGIVNDGTINASAFDFTLYIDPHSFTNNGTINVSNGATVYIEPTSFTNASGGSIAVGANSTAYIDTSSWSNAGAITVGSGAALYLDVSIATTAIGNLTNSGGTIVIEGTINNTGDMFDVGPAGNLGAIDLYSGGIIEGGTIVYPGSGIVFSGGTLSGVTYEGPLNLTVSSSSLYVTDGLTVTGSSGSGPGTINLTGANSYLYMEGTETLNTATNTATLNIGGSSYDYLYNYDPSGAGAVLTLGSNLTINQTGYAELEGSGSAGDGIVNDGTINASAFDFTLYIDPHSFTNNGTINVSNGATVYIEPTSFTNASGGSIAVGANSTAYIDTSSWSNAGAITVGSGAALYLDVSIATTAIGNLTNSGGTIVIEGTINNTGDMFDVGPAGNLGAIDLYSGGIIEGGTIVYPGSGIVFSGGTLSGVTYEGPLNLTVSSSSLYVTDGLTVTGSSGSGPGTINLTGANSYLYMEGTETLNTATNTATLNIGGSSYDYLYNYDPSGAGAVLTLGSNLTINQTGYAELEGSGSAGDGIVNDGTINASAFDFTLYIDPHSFTNNGTINVSNGATVYIEPTSFTNASGGSIAVGANSTAYIDTSSWSNAGVITVGSGAALYLDVSIATTAIGNLTNSGGTIVIEGTINNTGDLFDVGPAGNLGAIDLYSGGTIEGGTIVYPGSGIVFSGGTLSGVTYEGPLNLTVSSSSLYVTDGLTVTGSSGSAGTINLTGANSYLYMEGTETLNTATNTATLNIGGSSYDYLYNYDPSGAGAVLTLGSNLTINQTGYAYLDGSGSAGDGIVNDGTINASAFDFTLYIDPHSFTNNGTINVSNGATVNIEPTSFTNDGTIILSNGLLDVISPVTGTGSYTIDAGSTLEFNGSVASGTIVYFGASTGTLMLEQPSSFDGAISGSPGTLASGDVIYLEGFNATYTTATPTTFNSSTDTTTLSVTDPHDGLSVSLTLDGNYLADTFTVSSASGGADIADPPTAATIVNGGSLDISTSSNETVTFTGATGSLVISQPDSFTGEITGFTGTAPDAAHSDTIDLVGINYDSPHFSEAYNASTGLLTVSDGTNAANLTFVNFDGTLNFTSDGNGGTLITDPPKSGSSCDLPSTADAAPTPVELALGHDQFNFGFGWTAGQSDGVSAADGQQNSGENQSASVSVGGPGDDTFIFHRSLGTDAGNFNPHANTPELGQFTSAEDQHWLSQIKDDAIEFAPHSDGIMPPDLDVTLWHMHVQNAVHLH